MVDHCLRYAAQGWHVFPLHSPDNGGCSCGRSDCHSPAKHPRTPNGLRDATTNSEQIREWWQRWPDANIGIVTGQVSGIVVVDVDAGKGGLDSWAEIQDINGRVDTLTSLTGGGGIHLIFQAPAVPLKNTAGEIALGIDTRAEGGYIVAPASLHVSGRRYEWEGSTLDPQPLPEWLMATFPKPGDRSLNHRPAAPSQGPVSEGQRNNLLTSHAGTMRRRSMSPEAILAALLAENAGFNPPLSEDEVRRIARSVGRYPPGDTSGLDHANGYASPVAQRREWPEPMAEEAFYGRAGDIVRAIEPHTEADPVALLVNTLACFGNAVGRTVHGVAEADRHGCNVFSVMVGETAKGRKGSSHGHVHELFKRIDPGWADARIMGGLSSGEGLIWAVRDPIEKQEAVKEKGKRTGDYETVIVDEGEDDKRLLVYEPEFAGVLRVMARDGNTLSAVIRQAWDTGDLRTMVKNNPAMATGAHISILGHVTKDELLRYLSDTEAGNGFANRFMWFCVRRSKALPEGGGTPDYQRLVQPLHDALVGARKLGHLQRDSEAREVWAAVYPELSEGKPGLFGAVTARAEAQVLRLSVLYAAMDGAEAIRLPHLKAALAVWDYAEASARYIFGDATGDLIADQIMDSLRRGELPRTAINKLFQGHAKSYRIAQALNTLLLAGKARLERRETDGRTAEIWSAV